MNEVGLGAEADHLLELIRNELKVFRLLVALSEDHPQVRAQIEALQLHLEWVVDALPGILYDECGRMPWPEDWIDRPRA